MNLFAALIALDEWLFLTINNAFHHPALDWIFVFFSFYPLIIWLLVGIVVVVVEERKDHRFILRLFLALVLAGMVASVFIKPIVGRKRPDLTHGSNVVIVNEKPAAVPFNNDFAFPSGHAAVAFAGAYIITREEVKHGKHSKNYRKLARWIFYAFAALTAFSRIYLGKHYPLDVLAGGILGAGIGWFSWQAVDMFFRIIRKRTV